MRANVKKMASGRYRVELIDGDPDNNIKTIYGTREQLEPYFLYGSMFCNEPYFWIYPFNRDLNSWRNRLVALSKLSGVRIIWHKRTDEQLREFFEAERRKRIEDRRKSKELRDGSIFIRHIRR